MRATRLAVGVCATCMALAGPLGAQAGRAVSPPPQSLQHAGSLTTGLQDDIAAGRWDVAQHKLYALQRLIPRLDSLEEALEADGRMEDREDRPELGALVDSLANRLEDQRRVPALASANTVGRALLPLLAAFSTAPQLAVAELDVAGRDLQYAVDRGAWNAADHALEEIRQAYATVQPLLVQNAPNLNATVERRLTDLAGALQAHLHVRTHSLAGEFLQDVDLIHSTFTTDH
ncbi:MAG: hypothetical protein P8Z36_07725 [Gemmatimonadota bacterium]|jgi:hypothetical protein